MLKSLLTSIIYSLGGYFIPHDGGVDDGDGEITRFHCKEKPNGGFKPDYNISDKYKLQVTKETHLIIPTIPILKNQHFLNSVQLN